MKDGISISIKTILQHEGSLPAVSPKSLLSRVSTLSMLSMLGLLIACSQPVSDPNTIRMGTIAGPETELMEIAQTEAKNQGLKLDIVTFNNYPMPNAALNDGSIDANMFQHSLFLDADANAHGYKLAIIGKTFIYPMAIYSKKHTDLKAIPDKAIVAIPNDPSNNARALLLLAKANLISLNPAVTQPSQLDISNNPHHLNIKALDAAQLARILPDVDYALINTNYAIPAGLLPTKNGLFLEDKNSPYANIVVVRTSEKDAEKFKKLMTILHSEKVLNAAEKIFNHQAIQAW